MLKPKQLDFKQQHAIVPIDNDFLNQACVASIEDFMALDIEQCGKNDKFKVEGDLLYFDKQLYISRGPIRL